MTFFCIHVGVQLNVSVRIIYVIMTNLLVMSVKQPRSLMQRGCYHDVSQAPVNVRHCAEFPGQRSVANVNVPLYCQRERQPDASRVEHVGNYLEQNTRFASSLSNRVHQRWVDMVQVNFGVSKPPRKPR